MKLQEEIESLFEDGCQCLAHQDYAGDPDVNEWVIELIKVPKTLTTYLGEKIVDYVLNPILQVEHVKVEKISAGSPFKTTFMLELSEGAKYGFSGWPDFLLYRRFGPSRRLRPRPHQLHTMHGVGEIQSIQCHTNRAVTRSIAQAGIYGLGQFATHKSLERLVVVVITKSKGAVVLTLSKEEDHFVYNFVESINGYSLSDADELGRLAQVLISAVKWQKGQS